MPDFLKKHRNQLLLGLLLLTLVASYFVNQHQQTIRSATVSLPVTSPAEPASASPIDAYRAMREETLLNDMAALQSLCDQPELDPQTREAAAAQLQQMVALREKQVALEGALLGSGFSPCAVVVSEGSVTIVTEKDTLSGGESALLLTMAQAHTGIAPAGVRVITADTEK